MTGLMQGKRGLIMGLANDKSLAWGIAQKLREAGAELAFSYQGEALEKRVRPLAASLDSDFLIDCDVSDMAALDVAFATLAARWPTIDFVVHAIGFSDKNELRGRYYDTSLDNFLMTMNISAYSLVAVTKRAMAMMPDGGSILTLSYYGAEKVVPHYNVMGVAKAALETSVFFQGGGDLGGDVFAGLEWGVGEERGGTCPLAQIAVHDDRDGGTRQGARRIACRTPSVAWWITCASRSPTGATNVASTACRRATTAGRNGPIT